MKEEPQIIKEMRSYEKNEAITNSIDDVHMVNEAEQSTICDFKNDAVLQNVTKTVGRIPEEAELYKTLVENLLEGIVILDFKGTILFANSAMMQTFGFDNIEEIIGQNALDFIDKKFHGRVIRDQLLVRLGKGGFLDSYQAITKDGRKIWIEGLGCKIKYHGQTANVVFIRDISDRRKTWDKLIKLEKKYRAIAEMSADGIITLDPLGTLTYVNPAFLRMINYKQDKILDTVFRDYLQESSLYLFQQLLVDSRKKNKEIHNVELEIVNAEKNIVPIELSITPITEEKEFYGFICTVHDITERKKMEDAIRKSERLKTEFMNIAAHELKSPVTPIKGYLDLIISDDQSNDKIKKWAQVGLRNADRLLFLVNDILDVSRLENDTMRFDMRKIDTTELLRETTEDMRPTIEGKKLTFNVYIPDNLPPLFGDYNRLHQVFKNLFVNAIKFTDEGSISFRAEKKDDTLSILVEDTGIGIRPDDIKNLFKKFFQAETADNRKHEGTGLGLFICREILRKHKGDISVESTLGKGTTFHIALPTI
jgi:PAS domain S-box-containing protein